MYDICKFRHMQEKAPGRCCLLALHHACCWGLWISEQARISKQAATTQGGGWVGLGHRSSGWLVHLSAILFPAVMIGRLPKYPRSLGAAPPLFPLPKLDATSKLGPDSTFQLNTSSSCPLPRSPVVTVCHLPNCPTLSSPAFLHLPLRRPATPHHQLHPRISFSQHL